MIQLNLSPDRQLALENGAAAAGIDVSTFVWNAVKEKLEEPTLAGAPFDVWKREYDAFKATLKSRNPSFDDSRESIYD